MKVLLFATCALLTLVSPAMGQDAPQIPWIGCPCDGRLGAAASVSVPEGFVFVGRDGIGAFMEATENPISGDELGVVARADNSSWFVLFSFKDVGYVRDDEKDNLDDAAILQSIREGTEQANEARRSKGWAPLEITGWHRRPFYDVGTNNLTWSISGYSAGSGESINYSVRLLGRSGVMHADLVADPTELSSAVVDFERLLAGHAFNAGSRYTEFITGDKVASYGLTALIAGGVGAAAVNSGLLAKFWKFIVVGLVAVVAGIRRLWSRLTGRREVLDLSQTNE